MAYFVCYILLILFGVTFSAAPQVISANYELQEINSNGYTIEYAVVGKTFHSMPNFFLIILDVEFDQDVYLPVNWACPCTDQSTCTNNQVTSYFGIHSTYLFSWFECFYLLDPGPAAGYSDLASNTLLSTEIKWGEKHLYRINVQPTAEHVCPCLEIVVNISYANPSFFVSNSKVPSFVDYTWRKQFYNQDRIKICNSDPGFTLGYFSLEFCNFVESISS